MLSSVVKINVDVEEEPIHLLKMTCPSTGFIHGLRVPHNTSSAREAIWWVNWGIEERKISTANLIWSK